MVEAMGMLKRCKGAGYYTITSEMIKTWVEMV